MSKVNTVIRQERAGTSTPKNRVSFLAKQLYVDLPRHSKRHITESIVLFARTVSDHGRKKS